jgi:hypothetical protein
VGVFRGPAAQNLVAAGLCPVGGLPQVRSYPDQRSDGHPDIRCRRFPHRDDLVNTMRGCRKEKNRRVNPKVTLLVVEPTARAPCGELKGWDEKIRNCRNCL